MKKFIIVGGLLFALTCYTKIVSAQLIDEFIGVWHGTAKQDNNTDWSIKITLEPRRYRVDYPSLNCGGTWEILEEYDNNLIFKETITYGLNICVTGGKVMLSKHTENSAHFSWFAQHHPKGATGDLIRVIAAKNIKR